MHIFRIEHRKTGIGPFDDFEVLLKMQDAYEDQDRHRIWREKRSANRVHFPCPVDLGWGWTFPDHHVFGTPSEAVARNWMGSCAMVFKKHDMVISVYEAEPIMEHHTQVLFDYIEAVYIRCIEIM